jgi:hypothetical protein
MFSGCLKVCGTTIRVIHGVVSPQDPVTTSRRFHRGSSMSSPKWARECYRSLRDSHYGSEPSGCAWKHAFGRSMGLGDQATARAVPFRRSVIQVTVREAVYGMAPMDAAMDRSPPDKSGSGICQAFPAGGRRAGVPYSQSRFTDPSTMISAPHAFANSKPNSEPGVNAPASLPR